MKGVAIALNRSKGSIVHSTFTHNIASSRTTVYVKQNAIVTIFGCFFCHNRVTLVNVVTGRILGGTVYCNRCHIAINSSVFEHNEAKHYGGAVLVFYAIDSSLFYNNKAEFGGGFYAAYGT